MFCLTSETRVLPHPRPHWTPESPLTMLSGRWSEGEVAPESLHVLASSGYPMAVTAAGKQVLLFLDGRLQEAMTFPQRPDVSLHGPWLRMTYGLRSGSPPERTRFFHIPTRTMVDIAEAVLSPHLSPHRNFVLSLGRVYDLRSGRVLTWPGGAQNLVGSGWQWGPGDLLARTMQDIVVADPRRLRIVPLKDGGRLLSGMAAWHPSAGVLALHTDRGHDLYLFRARSETLSLQYTVGRAPEKPPMWLSPGRFLLLRPREAPAEIVDLKSRMRWRIPPHGGGCVLDVAWGDRQRVLALLVRENRGSERYRLYLFFTGDRRLHCLTLPVPRGHQMFFSPSQRHLFLAPLVSGEEALLVDVFAGSMMSLGVRPGVANPHALWSQDERRLVVFNVATRDGTGLRVFDLLSRKGILELPSPVLKSHQVFWVSDDRLAVVSPHLVQVFRLPGGSGRRLWNAGGSGLWSARVLLAAPLADAWVLVVPDVGEVMAVHAPTGRRRVFPGFDVGPGRRGEVLPWGLVMVGRTGWALLAVR